MRPPQALGTERCAWQLHQSQQALEQATLSFEEKLGVLAQQLDHKQQQLGSSEKEVEDHRTKSGVSCATPERPFTQGVLPGALVDKFLATSEREGAERERADSFEASLIQTSATLAELEAELVLRVAAARWLPSGADDVRRMND